MEGHTDYDIFFYSYWNADSEVVTRNMQTMFEQCVQVAQVAGEPIK